MKAEELYHVTNMEARKKAILNKINKQIETRIQKDKEYFELISEEEYKEDILTKYGKVTGTLILSENK